MKLVIKFGAISDGDVPSLGGRPRGLGITLETRRGLKYTKIILQAPTTIKEDFVAKLVEEIDFIHPELEVLEYINE